MFYNQPLSIRFGGELERHLGDTSWNNLDVAVAWVRASGVAHLREAFTNFLDRGCAISFIVGLDLQNTTKEGLEGLLDLESTGNSQTFVYHNESSGIFHPKLYLFRGDDNAKLIVGSNNLTETGLFVNVEAGLEIEANLTDQVIQETLDALASWRDETSGFVKRLDAAFLQELVENDYVLDERAVRRQMAANRAPARSGNRQRLFNGRRFTAPRLREERSHAAAETQQTTPGSTGEEGAVLLMRLRKASTTGRPTQTQIPIRVVDTGFFGAQAQVQSAHTGEIHGIHEAAARGNRNTLKLEIPEMRDFGDPVARFERTPEGIIYQVYDLGTPQGNQIMNALRIGLQTDSTRLTVPQNPDVATWWRFI